MGEWNRSTTILALEKIQPELRKRSYFEFHRPGKRTCCRGIQGSIVWDNTKSEARQLFQMKRSDLVKGDDHG
jgi:hypothetical protein